MGGKNTSLSSVLWNQVEVILDVSTFILNKLVINNASWGWITGVALSIFDEESLIDSLVHHNHSHVWLVGCLVVDLFDHLSELRDLLLKNHPSHSITNSISENEEVIWQCSLRIMLNKSTQGSLECSGQVLVNNLLTFLLKDPCAVVLRHLSINWGTEANNRVVTLMTNINPNNHSILGNFFREINVVQVSSKLSVNLSQNVGCNWKALLLDSSHVDYLWDNIVWIADIFIIWVKSLAS